MRMTVPTFAAIVLASVVLVLLSGTSSADTGYAYDPVSKTLTVNDDVPDYGDPSETPWYAYIAEMTDLVVSEGVASVGSNAFGGAERLERLTLPSTLTSVGARSFSGCEWLQELTVPSGVTSVGNGAFSDCARLAEVTLRSSPSYVGSGVFDDSGSLVEGMTVRICSENVPAYLFSPSSGHSVLLNSVDLTDVTSVSEDAFRGSSADKLTIPMGVLSVGARAFMGSSVGSVIVEGSPAFGESVFEGCTSLTSADISSVRSVPASMFRGCASLSDVTLSSRITEVSDRSFEGTGLKELVFPGTLRKVGEHAFSDCISLEHAAFTNGLERLGDGAFSGCAALSKAEVQEVSFPGTDIFFGCTGLERSYCPSDSVVFPAGRVYRDLGNGPDVLIRYDFGELDGSCTLFSDTVMRSSYIDGSENHRFEYWTDPDGNRISDAGSLTASTVLTAHWAQAEGTDGTFDTALCVLSVGCALVACFVCFRRS